VINKSIIPIVNWLKGQCRKQNAWVQFAHMSSCTRADVHLSLGGKSKIIFLVLETGYLSHGQTRYYYDDPKFFEKVVEFLECQQSRL